MSELKPILKAQPIEARVKIMTAPVTSQRNVNTRISNPVRGMAMISAMR